MLCVVIRSYIIITYKVYEHDKYAHCYIPMSKTTKNDEELWIDDKLPIIYEAVLTIFHLGKGPLQITVIKTRRSDITFFYVLLFRACLISIILDALLPLQ